MCVWRCLDCKGEYPSSECNCNKIVEIAQCDSCQWEDDSEEDY